jgi:TonB family protein
MKNRKYDIERYLRGELSAAEMHALEKEALNDPFLAEALEGIEHAGTDNFLYDLHRINRIVHKRARKRSRKHDGNFRMLGWTVGVAATVFLATFSAFLVINMLKEQEKARQLALQESLQSQDLLRETVRDTIAIPLPGERPVAVKRRVDGPDRTHEVSRAITKELQDTEETAAPDATEEFEAEQGLLALNGKGNEGAQKQGQDREQDAPLSTSKVETGPSAVRENTGAAKKEARAAGHEAADRTVDLVHPGGADSIVVRGNVTSLNGEDLPGVNVLIKGTNNGTVTDAGGNFRLTIPSSESKLTFSFIGFTTQEVSPQGQTSLKVQLKEDVTSLSEVVVTGYADGVSARTSPGTFTFAEPAGGRSAFRDYLNGAVKYPEEALRNKTEGSVTVRFTVEPSGELSGFEVLKGIGHGCDQELIRAIQHGPAWEPSRNGQTSVRDTVKVRFKFQLRPGDR